MRVGIDFGREHLDVEVREESLIPGKREAPCSSLPDLGVAVRAALETPIGFPALRRALTPDDHVTVVVDEHMPRLAELLSPLLAYLVETGITPDSITLLCPTPAGEAQVLDQLPDAFQEAKIKAHDPTDRRQLSYLATTRRGRRIYLNRAVVDADQLVVLSRRGYDPLLGYAGSEGSIYPALSDQGTLEELYGRLTMKEPEESPWPARQEAAEVAWLLGAPFVVQVIEGCGVEIAHVLGGPVDAFSEGQRLLDTHWRVRVAQPADLVVACVSGDPAQHDFSDLARALACASRVVKPGGRIVVLSQARQIAGMNVEVLRRTEDPEQALKLLREMPAADRGAAFQWANTVQHASVYLLSGFPTELAEELFITPLEQARQVQRLLDAQGSCLFLPDAHKSLAVLE